MNANERRSYYNNSINIFGLEGMRIGKGGKQKDFKSALQFIL
jgi:hypothetical protein